MYLHDTTMYLHDTTMIFAEKYQVSPLSILGRYFDVVSLSKVLHPHMLGSGVNEHLVGQKWQYERLVLSDEMVAMLYAKQGNGT